MAKEWKDLQGFSSRKVRYSYAVYAAEDVVLLDELAKQNGGKIDIREEKMRDSIMKRVRRCQAQLVGEMTSWFSSVASSFRGFSSTPSWLVLMTRHSVMLLLF